MGQARASPNHIMTNLFRALGWVALCCASPAFSATPEVTETFSTDPVLAGRFEQLTTNTESAFTYAASPGNLMAVLDVDRSPHLLSFPSLWALHGRQRRFFFVEFSRGGPR